MMNDDEKMQYPPEPKPESILKALFREFGIYILFVVIIMSVCVAVGYGFVALRKGQKGLALFLYFTPLYALTLLAIYTFIFKRR